MGTPPSCLYLQALRNGGQKPVDLNSRLSALEDALKAQGVTMPQKRNSGQSGESGESGSDQVRVRARVRFEVTLRMPA